MQGSVCVCEDGDGGSGDDDFLPYGKSIHPGLGTELFVLEKSLT